MKIKFRVKSVGWTFFYQNIDKKNLFYFIRQNGREYVKREKKTATTEIFDIVRLCCHPFSHEIVQDVKYGNNSRISALFWILFL